MKVSEVTVMLRLLDVWVAHILALTLAAIADKETMQQPWQHWLIDWIDWLLEWDFMGLLVCRSEKESVPTNDIVQLQLQ